MKVYCLKSKYQHSYRTHPATTDCAHVLVWHNMSSWTDGSLHSEEGRQKVGWTGSFQLLKTVFLPAIQKLYLGNLEPFQFLKQPLPCGGGKQRHTHKKVKLQLLYCTGEGSGAVLVVLVGTQEILPSTSLFLLGPQKAIVQKFIASTRSVYLYDCYIPVKV